MHQNKPIHKVHVKLSELPEASSKIFKFILLILFPLKNVLVETSEGRLVYVYKELVFGKYKI